MVCDYINMEEDTFTTIVTETKRGVEIMTQHDQTGSASVDGFVPTENIPSLIEELKKYVVFNLPDSPSKNNSAKNIIKVYRKEDAPKGAIFLFEKVERNGVFDLSVRNYDLLKSNEKIAYLFQIPIEPRKNSHS